MMEIRCILIWRLVTWGFTYVNIHQAVYLRFMYFTIYYTIFNIHLSVLVVKVLAKPDVIIHTIGDP